MSQNILKTRIKHAIMAEAEWASLNPVLLSGEVAYSSDVNGKYKIGDGTSTWSQLSYSIPVTKSDIGLGNVENKSSATIRGELTKANVTNALGYTPPTTNTTYGVATSSTLGLVKSGTDITVDSSGNVSVKDDSHNHIISNIDGLQDKLNLKAENIALTNQDLNAVTTPGFYNAGGSNSVTNKPSGVDHFGLIVIHRASGSYYTQIIFNDTSSYRRFCVNGTWGSWTQDKLTDTNTWRGIQNNLTSDSTTDSLSAAQGKALKALVDAKSSLGHTHDDRYFTESEINTKLNTKLNTSLKGAANGLAELDANGRVPSSQLPSYVDDVIEGYLYNSKFYKESAHTTVITGETGKIYVDLTSNKTYRWSGSAFVVISETLALGETSTTAYRGDRGKIAYNHSQVAHAPSNAEVNQNAFSNVVVGSTTIAADSKTDTLTLVAGSNVTLTPDATNDKITISSTDTNNKVTQNAVTDSGYTNWRSLIWGASNSGTEGFTPTTVTDGVFSCTGLSVQPSTGTIRANVFKGKLTGVADYSKVLNINNTENKSVGRLQFFQKSSDSTINPDTGWWSVLRTQHAGYANGYWQEMAYSFSSDTIKFRRNVDGTIGAWRTIAFTDSNVTSSTKLQTARTINGTSFNGTANITTANWGTARTIKIGATGKSVNGSGDITWSRSEIGTPKGWESSGTTAATAQWYRIATSASGINNCLGTFYIIGAASGNHTNIILNAGISYGNNTGASLTQVLCSNYSNVIFTKARLVYHTSYSGNYAYLEIYMSVAKATTISVQFIGNGWNSVTPSTAGSIPSGYTSKELSFVNGNYFVGNLSGNASTATKLATARTISLTGSVTGSGSFDGSGNLSIATTTNHTHSYLPLSGGTLSGDLNFSHTSSATPGYIGWNTGGSRQRIKINDGSTGDASVFIFQQSTDSGSNYSDLFSISANGKITANTFIGALSGNASTASTASKVANNLTISLNGTSQGAWNGSAAKSINITPSSIGASSSGHTHDDRYFTESEITSKLSGYLPLGGGTITGTLTLNGTIPYIGTDKYIAYPGGGQFNTTTSSYTGYLKITLPVSWTSTMMKFKVSIYNYQIGTSVDYYIGGYNYSSNSQWKNTYAICIGKTGEKLSNLPVSFGHDGTKCAITIGNSDTLWNYPQITISDVSVEYSNTSYSTWKSGWSIAFITSALSTVNSTIENTHVGYNASTNFVRDVSNNSTTTFAYSKSGMSYGDYTWLAGWNGFELRAVNKSQFAPASHTHNYAGSSSAGGSATKIYATQTNPTSGTTYYIPFISSSTTGDKSFLTNDGIGVWTHEGTTSSNGVGELRLGNSIVSGTAGNKKGLIYMFGTSSGYTEIVPSNNTTSNIIINLPSSSGTLSLNGHTHNYAGSSSAGGAANSAAKLATARTVRTNLSSTSTASFDGTSNITPGVTGTLPIANGGTGKTTAKDAANNLINNLGVGDTVPTDDSSIIVQGVGDYANQYYKKPSSLLWEYIKSKISSVLGLTSSSYGGNAATATKATQDSAGQQINTTYIKGLSVSGKTVTYTKGDGTTGTITTQDTNTTYSNATASAAGLMSASDKSKLDGITKSADAVSFSQSLTSGTKVGTITINGTGTDLYCQTNTDTHYTSHLYVGASGGNANATSATSNPYLLCVDNTTNRNSIQLKAGSNMSISAVNGVVTFTSTDTTYSVATTSANGLMSSTDKTKLDGIAEGANNYTHPTSAGNKHIPSGGSSGQILGYSASGTAAWTNSVSNLVVSGSLSQNRNSSEDIGSDSATFGINCIAAGDYCISGGYRCESRGSSAFAFGYQMPSNTGQFSIGHYGTPGIGTTSGNSGSNNAFVIGNGSQNGSSISSSNAFRVTYAGAVIGKAAYQSTGADFAELREWSDGNPNAEDRRGYFVTMEGMNIRIASPGDYICGIISANPSVIGNNDEDWMGRYVFDDFGAFVYEDYEETDPETGEVHTYTRYKENPEYDPTREYEFRADRPEWDYVGLCGVIHVRDDGTCQQNGFCKCAAGGIATASERGYRVLERVNDHIVKVLFYLTGETF